jgi:hypothetical protein
MSAINIQSLFADIIDTPEQRQQKMLQQGMLQGQQLTKNLTGLARAAAPLAQMAGQLGVQRNEDLRRGVQPLFGVDPRSTSEKIQEKIQGLDPNDPNSMLQIAQALQEIDPVRAASLREMAAKKRQENADREASQKLQAEQLSQAQMTTRKMQGEETDANFARTTREISAEGFRQKDPLVANLFLRNQITGAQAFDILAQQEKNRQSSWSVVNAGRILNNKTGETEVIDDLRVQSWIQTTDQNGVQRIVGLTSDASNPVAVNILASDLPQLMAGQAVSSNVAGNGSVAAQGAIDPNAEPPAIITPQATDGAPSNGGLPAGQESQQEMYGTVPYKIATNALLKYDNLSSAIAQSRNILENSNFAAGRNAEIIKSLGSAPVNALFLQSQRDLEEKLKPLKANNAFDTLTQMRQQSKTGGALGNVSNIELELLKSTVTSLETIQDPELLIDALNRMERHYTNFLALLLGKKSGLEVQLNTNLPIYENVRVQDGRIWFREENDGEERWYTEEPVTELLIKSIN